MTKNINCKCGKPKMELVRRSTGEKYLWSYCLDCENQRQKAKRAAKKVPSTWNNVSVTIFYPQTTNTAFKGLKTLGIETVAELADWVQNKGDELKANRDISQKQIEIWEMELKKVGLM